MPASGAMSSDESDVELGPQHAMAHSYTSNTSTTTTYPSSLSSQSTRASDKSTISTPYSSRFPLNGEFAKPRKIARKTFVMALTVFASFWATFMCFTIWQFHWGTTNVVDPIAFWENHGGVGEERRFRALPPRVTIPLPLPPQKVSVLLINYSRPRMIQDSSLMRTLLAHPNVDEVLLLHANPKTAFEFVHPKVVNIDATQHNDEMGLSLRFYFCQLAKNEWVLHVDDDMEFPTLALNELLIEYSRNPRRIVGRFGRDLQLGNSFHGYSSASSHKETEVILTKLMAMERDTCSAFFEYAHLVWDDVVLYSGEGPLWNGEDIFMSLVANHVYGTPVDGLNNYAMDWLDVWQASDSLKDYDNGKLDISGGMKGLRLWDWQWWQSVLRRNRHYSFRGQLWQTAKQRLAELGDRPKTQ